MVAHVGGYFGEPLKVQRGVTQGYLLYPKIINVVADSIIHNWVSVLVEAEGKAGLYGFERYTQQLAAYFYANNGLLTSTHAAWLQKEFNTLKKNIRPVWPAKKRGEDGKYGLTTLLCH